MDHSLASFALHLGAMDVALKKELEHGLQKVAKSVENTAKRELGVYQKQVGPFQDWAELADETKDQRARQGYTEDDPGLRSGKMRDSITNQVNGSVEAVIGSNDQNLVYFEFGTKKQPPRPVLGPAVIHNEKKIKEILGRAAVSGLMGGNLVHPSLGYDKDI